jgi:hypothetical protein
MHGRVLHMSKHFNLLIELDLVADLPHEDLHRLRCLVGLAPTSASRENGDLWIEPGQLPDVGRSDAPARELPIPGGLTAQLLPRVVSVGADVSEVRWSFAVRVLLLDDSFYEDGWRTVDWLARRSATRGFIGQAREEFELAPSWIFLAADGFGYAVVEGDLVPLSEDAPPLPADLIPAPRA